MRESGLTPDLYPPEYRARKAFRRIFGTGLSMRGLRRVASPHRRAARVQRGSRLNSRVLGVAVLAFVATGVPAPAVSDPVSSFRVLGDVERPTTFDLQKLRQLPATQQNATYVTAGATAHQTFTGALLWDVVQSAGVTVDAQVKNDILRKTILVMGADGYETVFSAGEIDPDFGGAPIIVAYEADGRPLERSGMARIVAPGDKKGGRFVSNIVQIEVRAEKK